MLKRRLEPNHDNSAKKIIIYRPIKSLLENILKSNKAEKVLSLPTFSFKSGFKSLTSVAKAMKVLRKLGRCLQIEVGIV